jgi:hypothetical protein
MRVRRARGDGGRDGWRRRRTKGRFGLFLLGFDEGVSMNVKAMRDG